MTDFPAMNANPDAMNALTAALQPALAELPPVSRQEAIELLLNTLDSPQMRRA